MEHLQKYVRIICLKKSNNPPQSQSLKSRPWFKRLNVHLIYRCYKNISKQITHILITLNKTMDKN